MKYALYVIGRSDDSIDTSYVLTALPMQVDNRLHALQVAIDVAHDAMHDTNYPRLQEARDALLSSGTLEESSIDSLVSFIQGHKHGTLIRGLHPEREDRLRRLSD